MDCSAACAMRRRRRKPGPARVGEGDLAPAPAPVASPLVAREPGRLSVSPSLLAEGLCPSCRRFHCSDHSYNDREAGRETGGVPTQPSTSASTSCAGRAAAALELLRWDEGVSTGCGGGAGGPPAMRLAMVATLHEYFCSGGSSSSWCVSSRGPSGDATRRRGADDAGRDGGDDMGRRALALWFCEKHG